MKRFLIKINTFLNLIGINLLKTKNYINPKNLIWFFKSLKQFNRLNTKSNLFSLSYLPILESYFKIESFSFISDNGVLHENVKLNETNKNNFDCKFGCGIFKLKKTKFNGELN